MYMMASDDENNYFFKYIKKYVALLKKTQAMFSKNIFILSMGDKRKTKN